MKPVVMQKNSMYQTAIVVQTEKNGLRARTAAIAVRKEKYGLGANAAVTKTVFGTAAAAFAPRDNMKLPVIAAR